MRGPVCKPDVGQQRLGAGTQLVAPHAERRELRLDVLDGRQRRDQVELLEDEAERAQYSDSFAVAESAESGPRRRRGPRSRGRARRATAEGSSCRSRSALRARRVRPPSTVRSTPSTARLAASAAAEESPGAAQLVEHHPTRLIASARRRRAAAARAPPASSPPTTASAKPSSRIAAVTGAVDATSLVTVLRCDLSNPKKPFAAPARGAAVRVGPKAPIAPAATRPEHDAEDDRRRPPSPTTSPAACPTDEAPDQPAPRRRRGLAHALGAGASVSSAASRKHTQAAAIESTSARAGRTDPRRRRAALGYPVGHLTSTRHLGAGNNLLDLPCRAYDIVAQARRDGRDVDRALLASSSAAGRAGDTRPPTGRQRRLHEADHREAHTVVGSERHLQLALLRVSELTERLLRACLQEAASPSPGPGVQRAPCPLRDVNTAMIYGSLLDVGLPAGRAPAACLARRDERLADAPEPLRQALRSGRGRNSTAQAALSRLAAEAGRRRRSPPGTPAAWRARRRSAA